jgi:uncharacterized protein with von Willebrand factor type A (vWA) domain
MPNAPLGGIIHTYQRYDPVNLPGPSAEPPDLVTPAFEHLLTYGNTRRLTEEELARAVKIDPTQIRGLGPSLDNLIARLKARKQKILSTYETEQVQRTADAAFRQSAKEIKPPGKLAKRFHEAVRDEQLAELEDLFYAAGDDRSVFARQLVHLVDRLGDKYQIEALASTYDFTGHEPMTISQALAVKQELELIDKLLKQLEEAKQTAQIGVIDLEELAQFAEPGDLEQLGDLQRQINEYLREMAAQQGIEQDTRGFQLAPKAYRLFQSKLLSTIFAQLQEARSGRHQDLIQGEGAVELPQTKAYEFGDAVAQMDIPASLHNALLRAGPGLPVRLRPADLVIHKTRNTPKCATTVLMDMSGSMRYGGLYINVKRMALALDGLIRKEFPGDYLQFIEMATFAKPKHGSEVAALLPKPVTIFEPWVRLKADMANPKITELDLPPHFTNIQHALRLARQFLGAQDTPNRQAILITDGLPTAHFEGTELFMLYPPDPRTEEATLREANLCAREGITINIFLLSSWNQSEEDVRFAYRLAESTHGRVFFVAGQDLDRFVLWDYLKRRRQIISG